MSAKLISARRVRGAGHGPLGALAGLLLALSLLPAAPAEAQKRPPSKDVSVADLMRATVVPDLILGKADAPITIVEYASLTCGYCGQFHMHVLPKIKAKYIEPGIAKIHLRPFAQNNLDAAGWMLAYCAGPERGTLLATVLFERQQQWAFTQNPLPKLFDFAKQAGFNEQAFNACVKDAKQLKHIEEARDSAAKRFAIEGTPTFFINGKRFMGATMEEFEKAIEPHLPKK